MRKYIFILRVNDEPCLIIYAPDMTEAIDLFCEHCGQSPIAAFEASNIVRVESQPVAAYIA